ncbi:hypothetical protein SASPL_132746 [Salvia splendens]|uniref:Uncharacterized protein n=1 Tax=Salvia splendens TaxID=180675 RepID=A0A8X8X1N5_SALSN|nr:hypothetical protein SASPL_132746 [Salvia splendens]
MSADELNTVRNLWIQHVDVVSGLAVDSDRDELYSISWDKRFKTWKTSSALRRAARLLSPPARHAARLLSPPARHAALLLRLGGFLGREALPPHNDRRVHPDKVEHGPDPDGGRGGHTPHGRSVPSRGGPPTRGRLLPNQVHGPLSAASGVVPSAASSCSAVVASSSACCSAVVASSSACCSAVVASSSACCSAVASGVGGLVSTSSADGKIKVWRASASGDRRKRSLKTTLLKHDSSVNALALTPDGAGLASGGGRVILVWERRDDGGDDEEMDFFVACCLKGHKGTVLSLVCVSDGFVTR